MNYKEVGFRAFYHCFTAIPLKDQLVPVLKDFPGAEQADHILTYGYIDPEFGMTLCVVAAAKMTETGFLCEETNCKVHSFIRINAVEEDECYYFPDEDGSLKDRYNSKLEMLHGYDASEEVEKTREMKFLDPMRHEVLIDDVRVILLKDGLKREECWVRITGLGKNWIMGTLLNEPYQKFGYHEGETIAFFVDKDKDDNVICFSNMNPSQKVTREDLEDGRILAATVAAYEKEPNEAHFINVLEILRDSYVWILSYTRCVEDDQTGINKMDSNTIENAENRIDPAILMNGDKAFLPIFSSQEVMYEYVPQFYKVRKHMLEVISLAKTSDKELSGIVLNPFSEPFVLEAVLWDLVEKMKSGVEN